MQGFKEGLQRTLDDIEEGKIRIHQDVSPDLIREFIDLAEQIQDPSDEAEIGQIVERYETLKNPKENNQNQ